MALPDIKDAGILASFTRWGSPFHGLISGGTIGTTGHAHPQPVDSMGNGNDTGWLIDFGMPAITLTPDEQTFATANHLEWRNYALVAGGYAYGKYIGDETYIHIDTAGSAWRVALAYSFPTANTLRLTAIIERFGYLRIEHEYTAPSPITKTVDVTCTSIELSPPPPGAGTAYPYLSRYGKLQDVFTNGNKALVGVMLHCSIGDDLFALVELTITGAGGEDGSGLILSAAEAMAQASLTPGATVDVVQTPAPWFTKKLSFVNDAATVCGPDEATITITATMIDWTYSLSDQQIITTSGIYARYGFYTQSGGVRAVRISDYSRDASTQTLATDLHISGGPSTSSCACIYKTVIGGVDCPYPDTQTSGTIRYTDTKKKGFFLFENNTVIDEISWEQIDILDSEYTSHFGQIDTVVSSTLVKHGALSAYIPNPTTSVPFPFTSDAGAIVSAFRSTLQNAHTLGAQFSGTNHYIGIHKMSSHAAAFTAWDSVNPPQYGLVSTPIGALTTSFVPDVGGCFAYQRQTGDYTFAADRVCYV